MSAIGNFETAQPTSALLDAYGRLFAWKLAISGVRPPRPAQVVNGRIFQAINGHRDAGSTACPGKHLYAQLPAIRNLASSYQSASDADAEPAAAPAPPAPDDTPLDTDISGSGLARLRGARLRHPAGLRGPHRWSGRASPRWKRAASGFGGVDKVVGTW